MRIDKNMMETVLSQFQNPLNSPNKKTACGYCRFSSDMQREESIEAQQRAISEYAEKMDIKLQNGILIEPIAEKLLTDLRFNDYLKT